MQNGGFAPHKQVLHFHDIFKKKIKKVLQACRGANVEKWANDLKISSYLEIIFSNNTD